MPTLNGAFYSKIKLKSNISVWQGLNKNDKGSDFECEFWHHFLCSLRKFHRKSSHPCLILRVWKEVLAWGPRASAKGLPAFSLQLVLPPPPPKKNQQQLLPVGEGIGRERNWQMRPVIWFCSSWAAAAVGVCKQVSETENTLQLS